MDRETATEMAAAACLAARMRPFLEDGWKRRKAASPRAFDAFEPPSARMCGFTAAFMAMALEEDRPSGWRVAGGCPRSGGGIRDRGGTAHGHFWTVSRRGVTVDLTADQFGLPEIIVAPPGDPRYAESFARSEVELHLHRLQGPALEWACEAGLRHAEASRPMMAA